MTRSFALALAVAAAAAALPAQATTLSVRFAGVVDSQSNTAYAANDAVSGEFVYDTDTASYRLFTVAGQAAPTGFASQADMLPTLLGAIYKAQLSPVTTGGTINATFALDLESLLTWPATSAAALLSDSAQLAGNLDLANSSFGYYQANADGTDIHQLSAVLSSLQVSTVPEPATPALVLVPLALLAWQRRRRA